VLWAGLPGAGREDARAAVEDALTRTRVAERIIVGTDVEAAFHDAFGGGPGVLLLAGTGSVAMARSEAGTTVRVGGWGRDLGDEGGGYGIGLEALRRIVRSEDGRDGPTDLRARILEHLGLATPHDLVGWIATAAKSEVARLVPAVAACAALDDAAARAVLEGALDALRDHVTAILERTGPWTDPPGLALWGGLISEGGPLRDPLLRRLAGSRTRLLGRTLDPPLAAARLALASLRTSDAAPAGTDS
jgi:N-acetylglucosamine kinase-like BadF-type ATPase